jgi:hypothetical protein
MIRATTLDLALADIRTNTDRIYLCSQAPTTFAQASSTYALGYRASPTINVPEAGTGETRKITIAAITDGVVGTAGAATHYALVNQAGSALIVVRPLAASKTLVTSDPWTLVAQDLVIIGEAA